MTAALRGSAAALRASRESGFLAARRRPSSAIATPQVYASRQPRRPQGQRRPFSRMVMCPISPAAPDAPRSRAPSMMMPPPTPVLTVRNSICREPRPAPQRCSAKAAALASLSSVQRTLNCASISEARGTSCQPGRLGGEVTTPRASSTGPGAETPIAASCRPSTPAFDRHSRREATIRAMTACWPSAARLGRCPRQAPTPCARRRGRGSWCRRGRCPRRGGDCCWSREDCSRKRRIRQVGAPAPRASIGVGLRPRVARAPLVHSGYTAISGNGGS